jgi:hypothetical protein
MTEIQKQRIRRIIEKQAEALDAIIITAYDMESELAEGDGDQLVNEASRSAVLLVSARQSLTDILRLI